MKKLISAVLASAIIITSAALFTGCSSSSKSIEIAIPNDTTNLRRAARLPFCPCASQQAYSTAVQAAAQPS